ncbi:hypothetical protein TRFO_01103 [Tritrichomonas foetus]|uniref:RRM domain-containing protein n=1 Tax=Tritrichomonas foetus TaxID=1144522 RepID=A0A1J4KN00_9EUKA|nr:hypothetical protein TRFO_01103 [Tritrichomonas foetus]|eukprot:OHT11180.1 hypothetical protein TRFO_01103 [Tritrichomonas foetus]
MISNQTVLINNIPVDTKKSIIVMSLERFGSVSKVKFLSYYYMNQKIRLNSVFVSFKDQKSAESISDAKNQSIEIDKRLVDVIHLNTFHELYPTAIILGDYSHLSKEFIMNFFEKYGALRLGTVYSLDKPFYTAIFESKEKLDEAIAENPCFVVNKYSYSVQHFGVFPENKTPKVSAFSKFVNENSSQKKHMLKLIHEDKKYFVNPIISSAVSGTIRKELLKDPKLKKITLCPIKGNFKPIYDLLWGKPLKFIENSYDPLFLYLMSAFLEIDSFLEFLEDDYYNLLNVQNAINGIKLTYKFGCGIQPNIRYIASHANLFAESSILANLDIGILQTVFLSEHFYGNQTTIDAFTDAIKKNENKNKNLNCKLIQSLRNLTNDEYNLYLSNNDLDLNCIRNKFIELFESGSRKDPQ